MKVRRNLLNKIAKQQGAIHIVLIGTKPDIIKQAPLIKKLRQRKHFTLVVHSGQHTQFNLSGGLEEEFDIIPDINLEISGNLYQQQSQIIDRFGDLLLEIKKLKKQIIPYICADTTTAVAAGIASFANLISTAHIEAGLRTMSPPKELILSLLNSPSQLSYYFKELKNASTWEKGSYEPYPEQFDTRAAGPSAGVHFAPTELNEKHLLNEGYAKERIFVVGNTVSDAIDFALKKVQHAKIYNNPLIASGDLIRFCIHRRENITSEQRFLSIFKAMETLIKERRKVVLISLGATERALREYRLKERVEKLAKQYKTFFYSPVLPYYTDTIAIMKKCSLVVTDSGSIQEETNILGIPGIVLRFNTDRPEAIFAGSNVIAPPITKDIVLNVIHAVLDDKRKREHMKKTSRLYGTSVSEKIVKIIEKGLIEESNFNIFDFMEHERLGLSKKPFWKKRSIQW